MTDFVALADRPQGPATIARIAGGKVVTAPLIAGDGIDLVMTRPGHRSQTLHLTCDEARELAAAIRCAADESERL